MSEGLSKQIGGSTTASMTSEDVEHSKLTGGAIVAVTAVNRKFFPSQWRRWIVSFALIHTHTSITVLCSKRWVVKRGMA